MLYFICTNAMQCIQVIYIFFFFGTVTNKSLLAVENEHFWLQQSPYFVW